MSTTNENEPLHDNLRDLIGQAISDEIAAGAEQPDWCDSREIDRLADAVMAVLPKRRAPLSPETRAALDEAAKTGALAAEVPGGGIVFINRGEQPGDFDFGPDCPTCGGSGLAIDTVPVDSKPEPTNCRAYTPEEVRETFLGHVRHLVSYWTQEARAPSAREKLEGLAFGIMNIFDGTTGLPAFDIVVRPHPDDKAYHIENRENWYEPGMVINDCHLHEGLFTNQPAAAPVASDVALRTATELARCIWRDNYKDIAPVWEPLPDLMGVLSQIDNMVCGMRRSPPADAAPVDAKQVAIIDERPAGPDLYVFGVKTCSWFGTMYTPQAEKVAEEINAAALVRRATSQPDSAKYKEALAALNELAEEANGNGCSWELYVVPLIDKVKAAFATEASQPDSERDAALREAVGRFIKAKGRYHTEQNYAALVTAFDAAASALQDGNGNAQPPAPNANTERTWYKEWLTTLTDQVTVDQIEFGRRVWAERARRAAEGGA